MTVPSCPLRTLPFGLILAPLLFVQTLVLLYQLFLVVFAIAVKAAKATLALLAAADTLSLWDLLGTLWAYILRPTFKQKTLFLRGAHY
jgi:hypothetical protein